MVIVFFLMFVLVEAVSWQIQLWVCEAVMYKSSVSPGPTAPAASSRRLCERCWVFAYSRLRVMRWGDQLYPSLPFHPGYPLEDGYVHTLVSTQESESVSTRNSSIFSTRRQDINLINLLDLYIHTSLHATGWIS